jgi:hypothetical protein
VVHTSNFRVLVVLAAEIRTQSKRNAIADTSGSMPSFANGRLQAAVLRK